VPSDGVAAVRAYREAAACFAAGQTAARARDATQDAEGLQEQVSVAYKVTQLRLERAVHDKDLGLAREQIVQLRSFLRGRSSPYLDFLSQTDRWIAIKGTEKKGTQ
jgi:hypothetical protein